jgi:hypothetical protein
MLHTTKNSCYKLYHCGDTRPTPSCFLLCDTFTGSSGTAASWSKTADQIHNMQVLTLITQLRSAVLQLPTVIKSSTTTTSSDTNSTSTTSSRSGTAIVRQDSVSTDTIEIDDVTAALEQCSGHIDDALHALDALATDQILAPYLSAAAYALERILGHMHTESFANIGSSTSSSNSNGFSSTQLSSPSNRASPRSTGTTAAAATTPKGSSVNSQSQQQQQGTSGYLLEFQAAITALHSEHFKAIEQLQAPYVQDSLRLLADRLVRSFITHAALVRPLEEQGKLKVILLLCCNWHLRDCKQSKSFRG